MYEQRANEQMSSFIFEYTVAERIAYLLQGHRWSRLAGQQQSFLAT